MTATAKPTTYVASHAAAPPDLHVERNAEFDRSGWQRCALVDDDERDGLVDRSRDRQRDAGGQWQPQCRTGGHDDLCRQCQWICGTASCSTTLTVTAYRQRDGVAFLRCSDTGQLTPG